MKGRNKQVFGITILTFGVITVIISTLSVSSIKDIPPKPASAKYRIGYINLNRSEVDSPTIERLQTYDCDIWLFAEWNGDNWPEDQNLWDGFAIRYNHSDTFTYGFLVMSSTHLGLDFSTYDLKDAPYTCNYTPVSIASADLQMTFLHVPPPVPGCDFQTGKYIRDALSSRDTSGAHLLIGDYNVLPGSKSYRFIRALGYHDCFADARCWEGTFGVKPGWPKLFRIDYCFYGENRKVIPAGRFTIPGSDHAGLVVDVLR